jgi:hypothetical protein
VNGRSHILEPGEGLLVTGLFSLLASAFLGPQVMLSLLALITTPLALILLFSGVVRARDQAARTSRQAAGFLLLTLAIGGLFAGSVVAAYVSAGEARLAQIRQEKIQSRAGSVTPDHSEFHGQVEAEVQASATHQAQAKPTVHWTVRLGSGLAPVFMGLGLLCWTAWSPWRCLVWAGIILLVVPSIRLLIHVLGPQMVMTT